MKKIVFVMVMAWSFGGLQTAQAQAIEYTGGGSYWMVERSDMRRYDNGRYTGLTQREVRSFVHPVVAPSEDDLGGDTLLIASKNAGVGTWFDGNFFVNEKTLSGMQETALGLDGSIPAMFFISPDGMLLPIVDNGFPTFRSFPAFPQEEVKPGDSWTAEAVRSVDPLNKGIYTKFKMTVLYTFVGEEVYQEQEVFRIRAQWATRYGQFDWDYDGDTSLKQANGSHNATIIVLKETGEAMLIQDRVDETFEYTNGQTVRLVGSINLFTEFPPALNTEDILPSLGKIAYIDQSGFEQQGENPYIAYAGEGATETFSPFDMPSQNQNQANPFVETTGTGTSFIPSQESPYDMVVEKTPAGLRLSVRDIQFLPDSSELTQGEHERIDVIADTLKAIPNAKFLVEGHSASTGNPTGEQQLSVQRANKIVQELVARGMSMDAFITNGFGSQRPIQSNDTAEGMAINRRVEITILE